MEERYMNILDDLYAEKEMTTNAIQSFEDAIADQQQCFAALSGAGRKLMGYFCTYTPVEILHASGFIPVRIHAGTGRMDKAGQHLPDFICAYMKLSLENALDGKYDFLAGLVQGYSCDAACGLVNIWKDIFKERFFHTVPLPYKDTPEARAYYRSALLELTEKLNSAGGHFSETRLKDSIDLYARIRRCQLELDERRRKGSAAVSSTHLMAIVDAGFYLPPELYLSMLEDFPDRLPPDPPAAKSGFPVIISGSLIEDGKILDAVESSGGRIVADDLCNGFRQTFPAEGIGENPLDRLIDRYVNRFPCPARTNAEDRGRRLLAMAGDTGAKAMVFVVQKFCTPHLADYPRLSEMLKDNGIASILVEMDETWQMSSQMKTRLESFFEMMGSAA